MSASMTGARRRRKRLSGAGQAGSASSSRLMVSAPGPLGCAPAEYSVVDLGDSGRVALMLVPQSRGPFAEQAGEVLAALRTVIEKQPHPMEITLQTIFLRQASDQPECERLLAAFYGAKMPVTNYVLQPPCCGAGLALEAWAIGGADVRVEHFGPHTLAVSYDHVRWVYCAGLESNPSIQGVYPQTLDALNRLRDCLVRAGSGFEHIVRTWFYLGEITGPEGPVQRYQELNRARADFYHGIPFCRALVRPNLSGEHYPASTGIGSSGDDLVVSCLTLQTTRKDAFLVSLENPQQTPAFAYHTRYSAKSPKFSRATALVLEDYLTTWISGTASIVDSESRFPDDIEKQTLQTIDNIERLIAPENFASHGVPGAGARLRDLAKVRVYLKRAEDYLKCKAVCERRFGPVPTIYAVADVCRPELLVEIEGIAFSRCDGATPRR